MTDRYAVFSDRPWDSSDWDPPATAQAVPTMLTEEEGRLLYWLGAAWAEGTGAVCDLGCFAGGSTARLAAGLEAGRQAGGTGPEGAGGSPRVHAFDLFTISKAHKQKFLYDRGVRWFWGTDLLPCARRLTRPWADRITLTRADLAKTEWTGGPVEILFIDAMKTPETADAILGAFLPALMPGRSVIVHQDYQHWRQPWIAAQMVALSPALRPIAWCAKNTVLFAVDRIPEGAEITAASAAAMDDARMIALLNQAMGAAPRGHPRKMIARSIMALEDTPGCRVPAQFDQTGFTRERSRALMQPRSDPGDKGDRRP